MSESTKIQWADATFNPWIGCARVLRGHGHETWGKGAERSRTSAANWRLPVKWNAQHVRSVVLDEGLHEVERIRVFTSLCDWLDDEVPIEWLVDFLKLICETPNLNWLLLTKRPENFASRLNRAAAYLYSSDDGNQDIIGAWARSGIAPENVWIGVSVENQEMADRRIPQLLEIPAKIRFLSVEPMLEKIDLSAYISGQGFRNQLSDSIENSAGRPMEISWIIYGGESGPNARLCNIEWIRSIVQQSKSAAVPVFVKQLGANVFVDPQKDSSKFAWDSKSFRINDCRRVLLKDKKGGDPSEWPDDLRIREFPKL